MTRVLSIFFGGLLLIAMATTMTGCATLADAQSEKGEGGAGTIKTYNADFETVWQATNQAVEESKLKIASRDKEKGEILAQRSMTLFSYGENVAIYVTRTGNAAETQVEVISKRTLATNITAANWEVKIFEKLDALLTAKK